MPLPSRRAFQVVPHFPADRGSYLRFTQQSLFVAGLLIGLLAIAAPALADHIGPHRTVPAFVWKRLACHYQAVHDPPGPGFFGCTLDLYEPPDGLCASSDSVAPLFNPAVCTGWPGSCASLACDISLDDSVESCSSGDPGCELIEELTTYPPATIAADLQNCVLSEGWCVTSPTLHLVGTEPLAGESILLIEGTRNGVTFACSGAVCDVPLQEGSNAFTFWARSSFDDTSEMGTLSAQVDVLGPSVSIPDSWFIWEPVAISVDDGDLGVSQVTLTIHGGPYGLRKYDWGNLSLVPDDFIWDRHFGEVIAPIGEYAVTVTATDTLGKVGSATGEIVIPDPSESTESNSLAGEGSERSGPPPSLDDLLARVPEGDVAAGPGAPVFTEPGTARSSSNSGPSGPERTVSGSSTGETSARATEPSAEPSASTSKGGSGLLWGAAAVAAGGAATVYSVARRRAREAKYDEMRQAAAASAATARASRSLSLTSRLQTAVAAAAAAAAEALRRRQASLQADRDMRAEQAARRELHRQSQSILARAAGTDAWQGVELQRGQEWAGYARGTTGQSNEGVVGIWKSLTGVGVGLWHSLAGLEHSRFVDSHGQIKIGHADPVYRWKVTPRYFHIDMPHDGADFVHLNAEAGPLRRWNHRELPSWARWFGNTGTARAVGKALVFIGLAQSAYAIVDSGMHGGDVARATAQEVGAWTGALLGAAIGATVGAGTPLSVVTGLLGAGLGAAFGYWAGGALYDAVRGVAYGGGG